MKIVIIFADGSPTPSVRGLAALDRKEDVLVILHPRRGIDAKNIVKEIASLPSARVVEAEVGLFPTASIEKVFDAPAVAILPRQTEIVVLPTTGWAIPWFWGGRTIKGWRPATMEIDSPSPIQMAMVTMSIFEVANARHRSRPQVVIADGDNLRWEIGGRVIPAPLTVSDWMVILGHRPEERNSDFDEFLKDIGVVPSWHKVENSRKTGMFFASGLAEAKGRAFWLIATNFAPGAELKLKILETILQLKNRGGDLPILVLANVRDTGGWQNFVENLALVRVRFLDMGEDPLVSPSLGWEGFVMGELL